MARFDLVGPSYRSKSVLADCQVCMNLYLEMIESGKGKSQAALYGTPGLLKLYDLDNTAGRGIITAQQRTFAITGTTLWELLAPNANPNKVKRGQIVSDGAPVSMAFGPTQLLIVSAGNLYCYQLVAKPDGSVAANTLTQVQPFNSATGNGLLGTPLQVQYVLGAFFLLVLNAIGTSQIQESANFDGSTWSGVAQTGIEAFSDNALAIFESHDQLLVCGPKSIQPYFDAGDFPFALDVVQGAKIEHGLAAAFAMTKADNSVFWLAQTDTGGYTIRRANGYTPLRVSTHALEFEIGKYKKVSDCVAYSYQEEGHEFVVFRFPSAETEWVYDAVASAQLGQPCWHQRGFWDVATGSFKQPRAGFHTFNFGIHIVLDPTIGAAYQQSIDIYSDFGNPIRRVRRTPHVSSEQRRIIHTRLQVDVEVGLQTLPGSAPPTNIPILDSAGQLRNFEIADEGILQAPLFPTGAPSNAQDIFINDTTNTTSWQVTVNAQGQLTPVQLATYVDSHPLQISLVTVSGKQNWSMTLLNLGGGIGVLHADPRGIVGRGPIMTLRWSNDGAQSWSNSYDRDCGQAGNFLARVKWDRLGQARDRVYEISMSDAAPWHIIDGYLFTDEDREPTSRLVKEYAKRA